MVIAICDDDEKQIRYLRELLTKWAFGKGLGLQLEEYESAGNFLFEYPQRPCDLLILDIEMNGMNGMELAKKLRDQGDLLPILFVTGYAEYMEQGYDVQALHYLMKPIQEERLTEVLNRYLQRCEHRESELLLMTEDGSTHALPSGILYFEAFGRESRVTFSDGRSLELTQGIGVFGAKKLSGFIYCHRSYLVNLRYVKTIKKDALLLDHGIEVPVSRRMYPVVNREFIAYYTKR